MQTQTTRHINTPETAAALQVLYAMADRVGPVVRMTLFRAIHHISGMPIHQIINLWESTR